jgi:hypothetical protein
LIVSTAPTGPGPRYPTNYERKGEQGYAQPGRPSVFLKDFLPVEEDEEARDKGD